MFIIKKVELLCNNFDYFKNRVIYLNNSNIIIKIGFKNLVFY